MHMIHSKSVKEHRPYHPPSELELELILDPDQDQDLKVDVDVTVVLVVELKQEQQQERRHGIRDKLEMAPRSSTLRR